jgi:hypothetical protein
MRNVIMFITVALCVPLVFSGCRKKTEEAAPEGTESAGTEGTETEAAGTEAETETAAAEAEKPAAEAGAGETAEAGEAGDAEKDCGALHDFMTQMIAELEKAMGAPKGKPKKQLADRDTFIAACKELPPEVIRCMNPEVAQKEAEKCEAAMKNADPDKVAKFKDMLK